MSLIMSSLRVRNILAMFGMGGDCLGWLGGCSGSCEEDGGSELISPLFNFGGCLTSCLDSLPGYSSRLDSQISIEE